MTLVIRTASLADAERIGLVHAQSWRESYAHIMSPDFVSQISDAERIARWTTNLAVSEATTRVAELDGEIVGFTSVGASRDDDSPRDIELWSIYVLSKAARQGVGTALAQASLGEAPAAVWVLEKNADAQAFYRRLGFVADGTRKTLEYWEETLEYWEGVTDMRMLR